MKKGKISLDPELSNELFDYFKSQLNLLRNFKYSKNHNSITHQVIIPQASYSPWVDDRVFSEFYVQIKQHTLVDKYRCFELYSLLIENRRIQRDVTGI